MTEWLREGAHVGYKYSSTMERMGVYLLATVFDPLSYQWPRDAQMLQTVFIEAKKYGNKLLLEYESG